LIIGEKAARKMILKLPSAVNFINILRAAFAPIFLRKKLQSQNITREKLLKILFLEKGAHKMLIKLTPGEFLIINKFIWKRRQCFRHCQVTE